MAKLGAFFGPHTGQLQIWVGPFDVGSGSFPAFGDYQAQFDGSYSAFGQSSTFKMALSLTDQNAQNTSGPCQVTLNNQTDNAARYQVSAPKLVITTTLNDTPLEIYPNQNGTQVDNVSSHNIWIGPQT